MNKNRINKIIKTIYNPKDCPECGGTKIIFGRENWQKNNGCADCFVKEGQSSISDKDLLWLISKAQGLGIAVGALQDTIDSGYDRAGHCANALKELKNV